MKERNKPKEKTKPMGTRKVTSMVAVSTLTQILRANVTRQLATYLRRKIWASFK